MLPQVPVKNFHHQSINGSPDGRDLLKYLAALGFVIQRNFQGIRLSFNSTDPCLKTLLVFYGVCQTILQDLLYWGAVYSMRKETFSHAKLVIHR